MKMSQKREVYWMRYWSSRSVHWCEPIESYFANTAIGRRARYWVSTMFAWKNWLLQSIRTHYEFSHHKDTGKVLSLSHSKIADKRKSQVKKKRLHADVVLFKMHSAKHTQDFKSVVILLVKRSQCGYRIRTNEPYIWTFMWETQNDYQLSSRSANGFCCFP